METVKISYEKMVKILSDGLELIDRNENGEAYRLILIPGYNDQIFVERCPEWDAKNDGKSISKDSKDK